MPTTTYLGLAYPSLSNAPNVPQDMQNLAAGVDTKISGVVLCTSGTRPTTREGATIYETDTDRYAKYTGSAWEYFAGSRVTVTPTLSASTTPPTMGTGATRNAWYAYLPGPSIHYVFFIRFGTSGTNQGSGNYTVSLPVTANAALGVNGAPAFGSCVVADASAGTFRIGTTYIDQTDLSTVRAIVESSVVLGSGSPWAWAASDYVAGSITYPI